MANYVAINTAYPTIGEVVMFVALRSGLVSAIPEDLLYDRIKVYVREQKGKDFAELGQALDVLQRRLQDFLAPPELGDIVFKGFRRILENYKSILLQGTATVLGRERLLETVLIPKYFVPCAAVLLKALNEPPFDFIDVVDLLRADAPLKLVFEPALRANDKSWIDLAALYKGQQQTYAGRAADHDIDDNKKLIRRWGKGDATPDLSTCLELLDALNWGQYSGIVFWVWIGRFLQKIDKRYRLLIADGIETGTRVPRPKELADEITEENDAIARMRIRSDAVPILRMLSSLLFYNTQRHLGDKRRVEVLLEDVKALVHDAQHVHYYVTWLEARYQIYCRDFSNALVLYERAFEQGMYGDPQAETMILPEWAALAQKMNSKVMLKRINSRMKILNLYPSMEDTEVAALRLEAFRKHFGAEKQFIESFV